MNYTYTGNPIEASARLVAESILRQLAEGERVLWLLSGGSGAAIATKASEHLRGNDLSNLSITMTDERYGPVGHPDENWQQILNSGFSAKGATMYRPLTGADRSNTTSDLEGWLKVRIDKPSYIIGIFGIGEDGHTAGIKPNSPAVNSTDLVASFTGDDFERITITFNMIKQIDEAVVQASGESKKPIIKSLLENVLPLNKQPAQILKTIPHVTFYSDNKREEL
jgi:6-phosphogluconolactonase/glucosamine-6-phosphate isomerase/deaminase